MQNGQAKVGQVKVNGVSGPTKPASTGPVTVPRPAAPSPGPFAFVDELPTKIRSLVQGAVEATQADMKKAGDRRYLDGMRRGAFLINMAISSLDGEAKKRVAGALSQLEDELDKEEKALREAAAK